MLKIGNRVQLKDMTDAEFKMFEEECGEWTNWMGECWLNKYVGKIIKMNSENNLYLVMFKHEEYVWLTKSSVVKLSKHSQELQINTANTCSNCKYYFAKTKHCIKLCERVKKTNICSNWINGTCQVENNAPQMAK
ncbi:MAG: hypothetical protein ACRC0V_10960 [Fusobacteriaceae bacterium]